MIWWVLLFFGAGVSLILAEFVLPGAVAGIMGGLLVVLSAGLGMYAYPEYAVFIAVGELIATGACIAFGLFLITKTGLGGVLMLRTSQHINEGYVNVPTDTSLKGKTGTVLTLLRPSGTIVVGDERLDAVAEGAYIPVGALVRVIDVHGNRVVVEEIIADEGNVVGNMHTTQANTHGKDFVT